MFYTDQEYNNAIRPYISGTSQECSYCKKINELILFEGKHTYITLVIGSFVEGYLQVCSRHHRTAATGLSTLETQELVKMKKIVRKAYQEVYNNNGIAFEHGKAGSCLWREDRHKNKTSLCHHCHIHFVPVEVGIRDLIKKYIPQEDKISDIWELKKYRKNELEAEPYLYFEDIYEQGYVYPTEDATIPRQFLRSCVATKMGCVEKKDWIKFPGINHFNSAKEKLLPVIQKLGKEVIG